MKVSLRSAILALCASLLLAGCESAWRKENTLAVEWLGRAETPPRPNPPTGNEANVAKLEASCRAGRLEACGEAGEMLLFASGVPRDPARAKPLLLESCRASFTSRRADARTCPLLGAALLWGTGDLAPDVSTGVRLLAEACGGKKALGCAYYGLALETGTGVEADLHGAIKAYEVACAARQGYAAAARGAPVPRGEPTREPLACLRLAKLAEEGALSDPPEVVANLYADVCLGMADTSLEGFEYRRIACPRAAALYFEHDYTFHPPRGGGGSIDFRGMAVGADAMDMAAQGCVLGEPQSCEMMRRVYDLWESRGDFIDTRED